MIVFLDCRKGQETIMKAHKSDKAYTPIHDRFLRLQKGQETIMKAHKSDKAYTPIQMRALAKESFSTRIYVHEDISIQKIGKSAPSTRAGVPDSARFRIFFHDCAPARQKMRGF